MNYAGVTIDFYDDKGATVRARFPDPDSLPDFVKSANVMPRDDIPNEDFALVALNEGHVMRKFACNDKGTTAMSVMYLMEHGSKLPPDAIKTAAVALVEKCAEYELAVPRALQDIAKLAQRQPVVDITGRLPAPIIKHASPINDDDWCVVLPDGSRHYPIDSYANIKTAERFFLDNSRRMEPEIRRQYAVKLAAKCQTVGYQVDEKVKEAGAVTAAPDGRLKMAMQARKLYSDDGGLLDEVFEKRAELGPEMTAQILNRYDYQNGLDRLWDTTIPDPWSSTYTLQKTADEVVWQEGADRVTRGELENLVANRLELVTKNFTDDFSVGLMKDPVGVFKSLPLPHKKLIARLAADTSADGSSEGDSEAPEAGEHKAE